MQMIRPIFTIFLRVSGKFWDETGDEGGGKW